MSNNKKLIGAAASFELNGKVLRRREQQADAADPYDSSRSFAGIRPPLEIFRRRRAEGAEGPPPEREKRIKFEILDEAPSGNARSGYNPYDADASARFDARARPKRPTRR